MSYKSKCYKSKWIIAEKMFIAYSIYDYFYNSVIADRYQALNSQDKKK